MIMTSVEEKMDRLDEINRTMIKLKIELDRLNKERKSIRLVDDDELPEGKT